MKIMTAVDLYNLEYGEQVYKYDRNNEVFIPYRYVARMPSSPERYLIFSNGESLTHVYIDNDGLFRDIWYSGPWEEDFVYNFRIARLEEKLERLKKKL